MTALRVIEPENEGEGIVALLEQCLEEARAGELSSVAVATVYRDGCCNALWSFAPSMGLLIGAVARLEHKLHQELDE